jgi:sugar/nucleoside kinase (ribokinase family)
MADVGCAGILVADLFCGPMDRLPAEGELLAMDSFQAKVGGCAPNVAISLAKQKVAVDLSGCVGKDACAEGLIASLQGQGIDCKTVVYSKTFPTSQTVILLVKGQDRRFIHVFGANREYSISHIDRSWLKSLKVFYLGGLFALPGIKPGELLDLLRFCRSNNIITVVDVVVPHDQKGFQGMEETLKYTDYFLPNDQEALRLTGKSDPVEQIRAFRDLGAGTVIITCGAQGAVTAHDDQLLRTGIFSMDVVDPSGSGDAFTAGIITGVLHDWPIAKTLGYASAMGASATRAVGCTDSVFTAKETDDFLKNHSLDMTGESFE